jgi:hypothetical protein
MCDGNYSRLFQRFLFQWSCVYSGGTSSGACFVNATMQATQPSSTGEGSLGLDITNFKDYASVKLSFPVLKNRGSSLIRKF